ncbi:MAG: hemoglobin [Alteromonadaceae bacterium]|jgi:hemoglobin
MMVNYKINFTVICALLMLVLSSAVNAEHHEEKKSLFDRLGGLEAIAILSSDFLDEMIPDEQLNKNRAISIARKSVAPIYLKYQIISMVCQATGGPCTYTGRDMKSSHAKLRIKEKEWNRMIVILKQAMEKRRIKGKESEELLAIVNSTKKDIVIPSM